MCIALVFPGSPPALAMEADDPVLTVPGESRNADPYSALEASFRQALQAETQKLNDLTQRGERTERQEAALAEAHAGHQAMIADHANLLAAPDVDLRTLSAANTRQGVALVNIEGRLSSLFDSIREFERLKAETDEQIRFYSQQLENVKAQPPSISVDPKLLDPLTSLMDVLKQKQDRLEELIAHYMRWEERFLALHDEVKRISARYEQTIHERQRERIVEQQSSPVLRIAQGELAADIEQFSGVIREMLAARFWHMPEDVSRDAYLVFLATFAMVFLILMALTHLLSRHLKNIKAHVLEQRYFYRYLFMQLLHRSLFIVAAIGLLYFYPVPATYRLTPFFILFPALIQILSLLLGVQWGLAFLRGMHRIVEDRLFLKIIPLFRLLLAAIFLFGTVFILIRRTYCNDCILLTSWLLLGQIALLAWTLYFLKIFYDHATGSRLSEYSWFENARIGVIAVAAAVVLIGILATLSGYGGIAVVYFSGLWHTALILLWAYILFGFLNEADVPTYIRKSEDLSEDQFQEQPYPVRWLVVRVMRLALVGLLVFSLPLAWGADRTVFADIFSAMNIRVNIGDFKFSTMGIVYAVLVLLIIHTLAVIWKSVLRDRLLKESDMEEGRKDSLTRISAYVLWAVGIMIAMPLIGLSGTSLALVFGAIGIGLGFGLQSIFKDFISGIILLFERPIQVGDVVEIDGAWGTVKEINVRATHVTTYDNSQLIIPNADFISRTVTNWSFRDPRIRRRIRVRVAYGSDIHQVKETLMNIAYKHPRVLRRPYPEVYFVDLGESAMLFELRVWLHVNYFITVETGIRDDISNQFKALGIRIAFPQQDIYIREMPSSPAEADEPLQEPQPIPDEMLTEGPVR